MRQTKLILAGLLLAVSLLIPGQVRAACFRDPSILVEGPKDDERCVTIGGNAEGLAVYNCGNYNFGTLNDPRYAFACNQHTYWCDSACGSPGVGGSGNTYVCDWKEQSCPPGFVKDLTSYSDYCGEITGCPGAGSA